MKWWEEERAEVQRYLDNLTEEEKQQHQLSYEERKKIVERVNARINKTVKYLGVQNRNVINFMNKLRSNRSTRNRLVERESDQYMLDKYGEYLTDENGNRVTNAEKYLILSRGYKDIMMYTDDELLRLDRGTKSWSKIKEEYKTAYHTENTDEMRRRAMINRFNELILEGRSDIWYKLLEEEEWTQEEALNKSSEEIYRALVANRSIETDIGQFYDYTIADMADPTLMDSLNAAEGQAQIFRERNVTTQEEREAARERMRAHRASLGI